MANTRYTGLDGKIQKMTKGTAVVGDGSTPLPAGLYETKIVLDTASGLPTGTKAGFWFKADAISATTPAVGEEVYPIVLTDWCFVQDASVAIAKAEIDQTGPCDDVNVTAIGRADVTGSFNGIFTDAEGWLEVQGRGVNLNVQDADLSAVTISEISNEEIILVIDKNKKSRGAYEDVKLVIPATLLNINNDSNTDGTANQTFSADFKTAASDTKYQEFIVKKA